MLTIAQGLGGMIISTLGALTTILILAVFLIWLIVKIIRKKPAFVKWILIILLFCIAATFMPQLG